MSRGGRGGGGGGEGEKAITVLILLLNVCPQVLPNRSICDGRI